MDEVSSTAANRAADVDKRLKTTTASRSVSVFTVCLFFLYYTCDRVRGGKARKSAGGKKTGRKQAGTAWFDLDAVFGFGPED